MIRRRVRLRFRKEGDLRLTSHRDVVRVFERLFRRAGLRLSMTEGFHPKARMNFPLPLSLGIAGREEIMEFDLAEEIADDRLLERVQGRVPPGLWIDRVEQMEANRKNKARVDRVTYEIELPHAAVQPTQQRMREIEKQPTYMVQRVEGKRAVDLLKFLDQWQLENDMLRFRLVVESQSSVHPREVLQALNLDEIEAQGRYLTRTEVHIEDCPHNMAK